MKIIDKTPYLNKNGTIGPLEQIQGTFALGTNWYADMKGQEEVIAALGKHLDNKYVLLRNPILPGSQDVRLPLVLSGPPGVFLLNVTSVRGMFRAKGRGMGHDLRRSLQAAQAQPGDAYRTLQPGFAEIP